MLSRISLTRELIKDLLNETKPKSIAPARLAGIYQRIIDIVDDDAEDREEAVAKAQEYANEANSNAVLAESYKNIAVDAADSANSSANDAFSYKNTAQLAAVSAANSASDASASAANAQNSFEEIEQMEDSTRGYMEAAQLALEQISNSKADFLKFNGVYDNVESLPVMLKNITGNIYFIRSKNAFMTPKKNMITGIYGLMYADEKYNAVIISEDEDGNEVNSFYARPGFYIINDDKREFYYVTDRYENQKPNILLLLRDSDIAISLKFEGDFNTSKDINTFNVLSNVNEISDIANQVFMKNLQYAAQYFMIQAILDVYVDSVNGSGIDACIFSKPIVFFSDETCSLQAYDMLFNFGGEYFVADFWLEIYAESDQTNAQCPYGKMTVRKLTSKNYKYYLNEILGDNNEHINSHGFAISHTDLNIKFNDSVSFKFNPEDSDEKPKVVKLDRKACLKGKDNTAHNVYFGRLNNVSGDRDVAICFDTYTNNIFYAEFDKIFDCDDDNPPVRLFFWDVVHNPSYELPGTFDNFDIDTTECNCLIRSWGLEKFLDYYDDPFRVLGVLFDRDSFPLMVSFTEDSDDNNVCYNNYHWTVGTLCSFGLIISPVTLTIPNHILTVSGSFCDDAFSIYVSCVNVKEGWMVETRFDR